MTSEFPTADIHTLTGAYAMDALSEQERAAFERHLAECPACAVEVAELVETAARLGAAASTAPPPGLRRRVLTEIAQTRQLPPVGEPDREVRGRPAPWQRRWPTWAAVTAAAASVVIAVVITIGTARTNQRLTTELAQLRAANAEVSQLLTAQDAAVTTGRASSGGTGVLVVSRSRDKVAFLAGGLPPLPADRTFQLWLLAPAPAQTRSAGLLQPPDRPLIAGDLADATTVAVTVEPAGGSASPTMPPILEFDLPS